MMIKHNEVNQFLKLYHSVYQCLHTTWKKSEHCPSPETIAVMRHLHLSGPLTVSEAAKHFDRSQSAMSELIDRLQANQYVDRIKDSRDKRKTLIWLTKSGRDIYEKTQEVLDRELLEASMNMLTDDQCNNLIESMKSLVLASQQVVNQKRRK